MTRRRGSVLLEVVISLGLFVVAAALTLSATRQALRGLDRSRREQQLVDVARSRFAELEAGLLALSDLRTGSLAAVGSRREQAVEPELDRWRIEVATERSDFTGLTLVTMTVGEIAPPGAAEGPSVTLRRLVRLRPAQVEGFEPDELLEGLSPDGETGP